MDDPRNTDNAWMETEAVNYHDESGEKRGLCNKIFDRNSAVLIIISKNIFVLT